MIIITGAAGFIASYVAKSFNKYGVRDIILVDDFHKPEKARNFEGIQALDRIHRDDLFNVWDEKYIGKIDAVIHLGARTDTTEKSVEVFNTLNLNYSKKIWEYCTKYNVNLIYASSAATYGDGNIGYSDLTLPSDLKPLNPYGESKNDFDKWALAQNTTPPYWLGLKFFNVYGPGEWHKGRMASVVFHAFNQINENGKVKLFRSHKEGYADGEQKRDFIYVDDIAEFIWYAYKRHPKAGLLNMGTGKARTFLDLVKAVFAAMGKEENIEFIDTPEDIRDSYQYFTEADVSKLQTTGYAKDFHSLEDGIRDYVQNFLMDESITLR